MTKRERTTRRHRRLRAKIACAIDFETRCSLPLDYKFGFGHVSGPERMLGLGDNRQLLAYTMAASVDGEIITVVSGGPEHMLGEPLDPDSPDHEIKPRCLTTLKSFY